MTLRNWEGEQPPRPLPLMFWREHSDLDEVENPFSAKMLRNKELRNSFSAPTHMQLLHEQESHIFSLPTQKYNTWLFEIIWQESLKRLFLNKISHTIEVVASRKADWDECGSKKPSEIALNKAKQLMEELLNTVISAKYSWLTPFISSDEDGHITVAWHKGEHELHLEISDDEVEYVTVWGINIDSEMDVGVLHIDYFIPLWRWLLDG